MEHATARMTKPVDPALFIEMVGIFQAATQQPMPSPKRRRPGYYLTDIPLNRGMLGTVQALREKGGEAQIEPILFRLMHMGEILGARAHFGRFIRDRAEADGVDISEALLKAAAVARLVPSEAGPYFDLDDVLQHARRFDDKPGANADEGGAN